MKILHVIVGLDVGGAEMMLKRFISASKEMQNVHHVVVSLTSIGKLGQQLQEEGIEVHTLGMRSVFATPFALFRLKALISKLKADAVQTWMYHADLLGGLAGKLCKRPVIWGIHSTYVADSGARVTTMIMRLCARLSAWVPDKIICVAEKSRQVHVGYGYDAGKMVVIPNGIDISRFQIEGPGRDVIRNECGIRQDEILIGTIGRFNPAKDYECFIRAAGIVAEKNPKAKFLMVGLGLQENNDVIGSWVASTGHADRFILLGPRSDAPDCLAAMDVFCLSSRTEALPTVICEAMAMQTPCVGTNVGDTAVLLDGHGIVVPRQNPEALADGLLDMIGQPKALRDVLGRKARKIIEEKYTIERARDSYIALYEQLLAKKEGEK